MDRTAAGDAHDLTAKLAYELWERRGPPVGSPEVDWFAAEKALASSRADAEATFSLYPVAMGPNERSSR